MQFWAYHGDFRFMTGDFPAEVEYTERLAARRKDIQEIIDEMDRKAGA